MIPRASRCSSSARYDFEPPSPSVNRFFWFSNFDLESTRILLSDSTGPKSVVTIGHLDVTLANGMLTIRGEKRTERGEHNKDKNWHVVERSYGSFSRAVPLPFDPGPAKVEAKFDKGVLQIHLPSQRSWRLVGFVIFLPL
jgi:Hsp20/alpha crystallin family